MKRSTWIYFGILIVLGIAAYFLWQRNGNTTLSVKSDDFAVIDTSAVSRVLLTDPNGTKAEINRTGPGTWTVNNKYPAKKAQVDLLLETISAVRVKSPVPLAARENVLKDLATAKVTVEIFKGSDLVKKYFVGGPTPDQTGTLMFLDGAPDPYITAIPGFEGYLTTRYVTREKDWRSTDVFKLNPVAINMASVEYPGNIDQSFDLSVTDEGFYLQDIHNSKRIKLNPIEAKRYLAGFHDIEFETFASISDSKRDSILKTAPFAIVQVTLSGKPVPSLQLYLKRADERTKGVGPNGEDMDRYYGTLGKDPDIFLIQSQIVNKILAGYDELKTGPKE